MTGCLGGVSVEKKENGTTTDSTNYERVVTVDYGTEQGHVYNEQVAENLGNQNSIIDNENSDEDVEQPVESTITEENESSSTNGDEYCGTIYKKFQTSTYVLENLNGKYKLSLPSNIEYGLQANLNFPNDSAQVCINGVRTYGFDKLSYINYNYFTGSINVTGLSTSLIVSTEHPERKSYNETFSYEFCGTVQLESNPYNNVGIYKITTHEGQNFDLKFSTKLGNNQGAPESFIYDIDDLEDSSIDINNGYYCLYSNEAPGNEELWTSRKFYKVQSISGSWE